jgi:hypothetical protein
MAQTFVVPWINVAEAVVVPLSLEETVTTFVEVPEAVPVIVTVTVQLAPGASETPLRLRLPPLAAAVTVPPAQVVEAFGTAAF